MTETEAQRIERDKQMALEIRAALLAITAALERRYDIKKRSDYPHQEESRLSKNTL